MTGTNRKVQDYRTSGWQSVLQEAYGCLSSRGHVIGSRRIYHWSVSLLQG
jgi:hypothetical protein